MALEDSKLETKLATLSDRPIPDAPVFRRPRRSSATRCATWPRSGEKPSPSASARSSRRAAGRLSLLWTGIPQKNLLPRDSGSMNGRGQPFGDGREYTLEEYRRMADAFYARRIAKYPDLKGDALKRLEGGPLGHRRPSKGEARCRIWQRHRRERILEWLPARASTSINSQIKICRKVSRIRPT